MCSEFLTLAHDVVTGARWFAGKGRPTRLGRTHVLPWTVGPLQTTAPGELYGVRPVLVEVFHDDAPDPVCHTYQLLVTMRIPGTPEAPGNPQAPDTLEMAGTYGTVTDPDLTGTDHPVVVGDAAADPEAMAEVLTMVWASAEGVVPDEAHRTTVAHHLVRALPGEDLQPQMFTGEQSNTSVFFGEALVLKIFRRLEPGRNRDVTLHEVLGQVPHAQVATLYGWAEGTWPGPDGPVQADLMMVGERFRHAEDGWQVATAACAADQDFTDRAGELGRVLQAIHQGLAAHLPTDTLDGARVGASMRQRLDRAAADVAALEPYRHGVAEVFAALSGHRIEAQQVHGDFHLGQVLATPHGWRVIDFEGEPLKSRTEREAPDSVWRDVAGALRSFDYAAASAGSHNPRAAAWRDACRAAFLTNYCQSPPTAEDQAILQAYEADKAVYEVVYEVRNRPQWVSIPLAAVAGLASSGPGSPGGTTDAHKEDEDHA